MSDETETPQGDLTDKGNTSSDLDTPEEQSKKESSETEPSEASKNAPPPDSNTSPREHHHPSRSNANPIRAKNYSTGDGNFNKVEGSVYQTIIHESHSSVTDPTCEYTNLKTNLPALDIRENIFEQRVSQLLDTGFLLLNGLDGTMLNAICGKINYHLHKDEYAAKLLAKKPDNFQQLQELILQIRSLHKEGKILLIQADQVEQIDQSDYYDAFYKRFKAHEITSFLLHHRICLIHVLYAEICPNKTVESIVSDKTVCWSIDYLHHTLYNYFNGDPAKTEIVEFCIRKEQLKKNRPPSHWYSIVLEIIRKNALEGDCEHLKNQFENGFFDKYTFEQTSEDETVLSDKVCRTLIFVAGMLPGSSFNECNELMKLLLSSYTALLSKSTGTDAGGYSYWLENCDAILKNCGAAIRHYDALQSGLNFIDVVRGDSLVSKLNKEYPGYVKQQVQRLIKSKVPFLLTSHYALKQMVILVSNELMHQDDERQLTTMLELMTYGQKEPVSVHEENIASGFLALLIRELFYQLKLVNLVERFLRLMFQERKQTGVLLGALEQLGRDTDFNIYPYLEFVLGRDDEKFQKTYERHKSRVRGIIYRLIRLNATRARHVLSGVSKWRPSVRARIHNLDEPEYFSLKLLGNVLPSPSGFHAIDWGKWPSSYWLFQDLPEKNEDRKNYFKIIAEWVLYPLLKDVVWVRREQKEIRAFARQLLDRKSYKALLEEYSDYIDAKAIISMFWNSELPFLPEDLDIRIIDATSETMQELVNEMSGLIRELLLTMEIADIIAFWFLMLLGETPARAHPEALAVWELLLGELIKVATPQQEAILLWHWNNYTIWNIHRNGVHKAQARELRIRYLQQKEKVVRTYKSTTS